MRPLLLALLLIHLPGFHRDCAAEPVRAVRPMLKGVELYSWLEPGTQEWRFALLPGTNRNKMSAEIRDNQNVIHSIDDLENAVSKLASSESVFWLVPEAGGFSRPPEEVTNGIIEYAAALGVGVLLITR